MAYVYQEYPKWIDAPAGRIVVADAAAEAAAMGVKEDEPEPARIAKVRMPRRPRVAAVGDEVPASEPSLEPDDEPLFEAASVGE